QRDALRCIESAGSEEIVEAVAWNNVEIGRMMRDANRHAIREISFASEDATGNGRVARDGAWSESEIVQAMDQLSDQRTGEAEFVVFGARRITQLAQSAEKLG